jgi:excisionase family DNA binding protein
MTLTPRQWRQLLFLSAEELRERRAGKPPGVQSWNAELVRAVELELATSEAGTEFDCGNEQSEAKVPISARQAANILECSDRYVRDIAKEKLGGVRVGGRWVFNEDDVLAYAEGRTNDRAAG